MSDLFEVQSKLMATPGPRHEFDPGDGNSRIGVRMGQSGIEVADLAAAGHPPAGEARLAVDVVHHLERGVIEVLADREVDLAIVLGGVPGDQRVVRLLGLPILELAAELAVSLGVEGHDDDAAGVPVESMHDPGPGMGVGDPLGEAVGLLRADSRHREEPGRLVEHDQAVVEMENGGHHGGRSVGWWR